jgi:hypothetical protein
VALADTSISGKGESGTFVRLDRGDTVKPFRHQLRGAVGEVVTGNRFGRIGREIPQILMRTDLDDVFNFFLIHLGWRAILSAETERMSGLDAANMVPVLVPENKVFS